MADLDKQIDEGQEKWRKGPDLTSITDTGNYIKFKTLEYEYFKLMNDDLWEQYREDFADFKEANFKACSVAIVRKLRALLRSQGVWVSPDRRQLMSISLCNTLRETKPTE
jgi:hypothetical protein